MRLFFVALMSCLFLTGCAVTVDEPQTSREEYEKSLGTTNVPLPLDDAIYVEQTKREKIVEKLEEFFQLDWLSRKELDAREIHYLALGDSLTRGIGDEYNRYGYTVRLAEKLEQWPAITKVQLDNRGKRGRRSDQLLELLEKGHYDKELAQADLITITMGGNDVMKIVKSDIFSLRKEMFDAERDDFNVRYAKIINAIRERNAEVPLILIGFYNPFSIITDEVTPFESIIFEWNEDIEMLANEDVNACFVPVSDLFETNEDMVYHTDFFHPNAAGYEKMTERIAITMKQCGIEEMSDGLIGFEE
ncbi:GDSL-type esterase/lipase family protein [Solibacillus sp. CAU 1738]|uniref:GDSL-type esterase/lipase family protein n=1 Tax=Solibacillus sp. CAU 1738 TaxID=3140363 RepID=UPI003261460F